MKGAPALHKKAPSDSSEQADHCIVTGSTNSTNYYHVFISTNEKPDLTCFIFLTNHYSFSMA
jgi:hypothetical protein